MIQIDMEMPQNCKFCPLHDVNPDQCPIRTIYKDDYATSRFTDCPLYKIAKDTDTISRKAAITEIARWIGYIDEDMILRIQTGLRELPSAQPETHEKRTETHACDCISRKAAIDAVDSETVSTNPEHFKSSEKFIKFMNNADISSFGKWQWANGFNTALVATTIRLKKLPSAQPEPHWIPCSERLPESTVLATVETKMFKHKYICEAVWIPRWSKIADFDSWEDCSEYNEDEDEYYVLEGWYERIHNWDEYSFVGIEDKVIAWKPLPEPYNRVEKGT